MNTKAKEPGFTLVELMVTLTVLSALLVVGVPAFQTFIQNNRQTSEQNGLLLTLLGARSEAVRANVPVVVCASTNGLSCRNCGSDAECGNWEDGWITFTDVVRGTATTEGLPNLTAGGAAELCEPNEDCLLSASEGLNAGSTLRLAGTANGNAVVYDTTGANDLAASLTFTMCMPKTTVYKQLTISSTGRPMTGDKSPTGPKVTSCP